MVQEKITIKGMKRKFECSKCGTIITTEDYIIIPIAPIDCDEKKGGCGRVSYFYDVTSTEKRKLETKNE